MFWKLDNQQLKLFQFSFRILSKKKKKRVFSKTDWCTLNNKIEKLIEPVVSFT